jgi:Protein of unknown function (DUF742)
MSDPGARLPDPRMIPRWTAPRSRPPDPPPETTLTEPTEDDHVDETVVRPFLVTAGRTQPLHDGLRIHTVLTAPPGALHAPLRFELRRIVELCQVPRSVADVAAALAVPLGVARVLIADLVNGSYVTCHDQNEEDLSVDVIERIADRVRAL